MEHLLELYLLSVRVDSCGDEHLDQLVVVRQSRANLLPQLWVEAEERNVLMSTAGTTTISQSLRLSNLEKWGNKRINIRTAW